MLVVRWLSAVTVLLVLLQAALFGQALYLGEMSLLTALVASTFLAPRALVARS